MAVGTTEVEQAKTFAQEIAAWMPLISGLAVGALTGGVAILVGRMNNHSAREREERSAAERRAHELKAIEDKRQQELIYIATELVFMLERYAEGSAQVAGDDGKKESDGRNQAERIPGAGYPAPLNFDNVAGDWRSLPSARMYNIRELPLRQAEAMGAIVYAQEHATPGDYPEYFRERQYAFALLGIRALSEARLLRKLCNLPPSRLNKSTWSAQPVMVGVWKRERAKRFREHSMQHDDRI